MNNSTASEIIANIAESNTEAFVLFSIMKTMYPDSEILDCILENTEFVRYSYLRIILENIEEINREKDRDKELSDHANMLIRGSMRR